MEKASPLQIVLASQSPRRRELAEAEGWQVEVCPPPEEAESGAGPRQAAESLEAWVARLATAKAAAVVRQLGEKPSRLVLACDTIGVIDDEPLGKPQSRENAHLMLRKLSGKRHRVLTGSCLWPTNGGPHVAVTESLLDMQPLSEGFLQQYLESGLWRGKAGACGFQDGVIPLELHAGSGANVIGLPVETIRRELEKLTAATKTDANAPRADRADAGAFAWYPADAPG